MSTNKKIIIAILLIIVTAGIYYFYTKSSENASTTKYERIYSYLTGWSDLKKDYYKRCFVKL